MEIVAKKIEENYKIIRTMEEFKKLGLSNTALIALEKKGFSKPTQIQTKAIPLLLEGKVDVVGHSQTGTGKTASFALPIIEKIRSRRKGVQAIILTPTRELALQVAREIESLSGDKRVKVLAVYGGSPISTQRQKLKGGIDIVVGTPGRVMDLQRRKSLKLDQIQFAVLDEADEMLNMGFVEDIETILQNTPEDKTMLLFSATMPKQILRIARKYMREYELIEVEKTQLTTETIEQIYYEINPKDRVEGLRRIINNNLDFHGIVFCNTRATTDNLARQLVKMGYRAAALHGDITQNQREKILQQFRDKAITVLVATDVAARGIDVNDLTHVINYSLPRSPESYVHRIGRTGRAGKRGVSITFIIPSEKNRLRFVEKINKCKLTKKSLPSIQGIIKNKEAQIKDIIKNIINANEGKSSTYSAMSKELLQDYEPNDIIAAILKYSFKNELDSNMYKEISQTGRGDGFTSKSENSHFRRKKEGKKDRSSRRRSKVQFKSRSHGKPVRNTSGSRDWNERRNEGRDEQQDRFTQKSKGTKSKRNFSDRKSERSEMKTKRKEKRHKKLRFKQHTKRSW